MAREYCRTMGLDADELVELVIDVRRPYDRRTRPPRPRYLPGTMRILWRAAVLAWQSKLAERRRQ